MRRGTPGRAPRYVFVSRFTGVALFALLFAAAFPAGARAQTFEERLQLCVSCHGQNGTSVNPEIPSLGAQPSMYALIQLFMFRQKLRIAPPMNDMVEGVSDADLQRFADVIGKLPPPEPGKSSLDGPGEDQAKTLIATHRCNFCHQRDLAGAESVPRLAGQREDYLLKALREYKSGARREYQPVMVDVVRPLRDEDFTVLARYLAALH